MNKVKCQNKRNQKLIPKESIYLVPDDQLTPSILDIKTENWRETEEYWSDTDSSCSSEYGTEHNLTGIWRKVPAWKSLHEKSESSLEKPLSTKKLRPVTNLNLVRKCSSSEGRLESFMGRAFHSEFSDNNEGTKVARIKPKIDLKPLPGIDRPRFVWQVESETDLTTNREIKTIHFHDASVIENKFRIWRKNALKKIEEELNFEEEEKIEDLLSLELLEAMEKVFENRSLTLEEYKKAIGKALNIPEGTQFPSSLIKLFTRIDTFGVGRITWDDLCDFLQQQFAERAEMQWTSPAVALYPPAKVLENPHKTPIIRAFTLQDKGLMTFSENGIVSLWTSNFKPRISRSLGNASNNLKTDPSIILERKMSKWYTDIAHLQKFSKYVISTGEKELQFYDTATYDPLCQLSHLYSVPLRLDAKITGHKTMIIVMGSVGGVVTILWVEDALNDLRIWSQQRRVNNIPSMKIEDAIGDKVRYIKYQMHGEGELVSHIMYSSSLDRIISAAMDEKRPLVMGKIFSSRNGLETMDDLNSGYIQGVSDFKSPPKVRNSLDEVTFPGILGCRTFDIWEERHWIVAGGLDRLVWVWNLYVPTQPIAKLRGHNAGIFRVIFDTQSDTIFSICFDKVIRIWQLYTNTCIQILDVKLTNIRGNNLHCFYPTTQGVFVQTNDFSYYIKLKRKDESVNEKGATHKDPITAVLYNPHNGSIISCSSEDIFVWDCQTGDLISAFNTIGGDGSMHLETIKESLERPPEQENIFVMPKKIVHGREQINLQDVGVVTCIALDNAGRRLFTAHETGIIKVWNFYNGRNLYNLYKPKDNMNICDMEYVTINPEHKYLITVGWDRRVVIYVDSQGPEVVHQLTLPNEPKQFTHKLIGHKDDIISVSYGYPNIIASGDYSGKLLVWSLNSGHVVAFLKPNPCRDRQAVKAKNITSLTFHTVENKEKKTRYLISSGPFHLLHIWRANTTRELNIGSVGWNRPVAQIKDYVTAIRSSKLNGYIVTADTWGFVTIWKIEDNLGDKEPTTWFSKRYLARHDGKDIFGFRPPGARGTSDKKPVRRHHHKKHHKEGDSANAQKVDPPPPGTDVLQLEKKDKEKPGSKVKFETVNANEENTQKMSNLHFDREEDENYENSRYDLFQRLIQSFSIGRKSGEDDEEGEGEEDEFGFPYPRSVDNDSLATNSRETFFDDESFILGEPPKEFTEEQKTRMSIKKKGYGLGPVQLRIVKSWKCHTDGFAALEVADEYGLIITGGKDQSVRIWDFEGRHIGILGQSDKWLIGDPLSYSLRPPTDVGLDIKRVRGLELFHRDPPKELPIEIMADKVTKKLLEQTERRKLTEEEIWEKALAYKKLNFQCSTTSWNVNGPPVGPFKKYYLDLKALTRDKKC